MLRSLFTAQRQSESEVIVMLDKNPELARTSTDTLHKALKTIKRSSTFIQYAVQRFLRATRVIQRWAKSRHLKRQAAIARVVELWLIHENKSSGVKFNITNEVRQRLVSAEYDHQRGLYRIQWQLWRKQQLSLQSQYALTLQERGGSGKSGNGKSNNNTLARDRLAFLQVRLAQHKSKEPKFLFAPMFDELMKRVTSHMREEVHSKIETVMNRLGVRCEDPQFVKQLVTKYEGIVKNRSANKRRGSPDTGKRSFAVNRKPQLMLNARSLMNKQREDERERARLHREASMTAQAISKKMLQSVPSPFSGSDSALGGTVNLGVTLKTEFTETVPSLSDFDDQSFNPGTSQMSSQPHNLLSAKSAASANSKAGGKDEPIPTRRNTVSPTAASSPPFAQSTPSAQPKEPQVSDMESALKCYAALGFDEQFLHVAAATMTKNEEKLSSVGAADHHDGAFTNEGAIDVDDLPAHLAASVDTGSYSTFSPTSPPRDTDASEFKDFSSHWRAPATARHPAAAFSEATDEAKRKHSPTRRLLERKTFTATTRSEEFNNLAKPEWHSTVCDPQLYPPIVSPRPKKPRAPRTTRAVDAITKATQSGKRSFPPKPPQRPLPRVPRREMRDDTVGGAPRQRYNYHRFWAREGQEEVGDLVKQQKENTRGALVGSEVKREYEMTGSFIPQFVWSNGHVTVNSAEELMLSAVTQRAMCDFEPIILKPDAYGTEGVSPKSRAPVDPKEIARLLTNKHENTHTAFAKLTPSLVLRGHDRAVGCIAVPKPQSGGKLETIVSGSFDGTMRVWSLEENAVMRVEYHRDRVAHLIMIGDFVCSASDDKTVRVVRQGTWDVVCNFYHRAWITAMAEMHGFLVTSGYDCNVYVWDLNNRCLHAVLEGHTQAVSQFLSFGNTLISASLDGTAKCWVFPPDLAKNVSHQSTKVPGLVSHQQQAVSPRKSKVAPRTTSNVAPHVIAKKTHLLPGQEDPTVVKTFGEHDAAILKIIQINEDMVATGSRDGTIRVWDTVTQEVTLVIHANCEQLTCMAMVPPASILCCCADGSNILYNYHTAKSTAEIETSGDRIMCVSLLPSHRIALGGASGRVYIANTMNGRVSDVGNYHTNEVNSLVLVDGVLVSCSDDRTIAFQPVPAVRSNRSASIVFDEQGGIATGVDADGHPVHADETGPSSGVGADDLVKK